MCAPDSRPIENVERKNETRPFSNGSNQETIPKPLNTKAEQGFSSRRRHTMSEVSLHFVAGAVMSLFFAILAAYLPYFLAPKAAEATYQYAYYVYDRNLSYFDNTFWTWGTDYILAFAMGTLIWSFPRSTKGKQTSASRVQTRRSQGMLLSYLLSVLAGGLAHQFYTTFESRHHWSFRFLWTICVGTVTIAPAFMGTVATELNHIDWETRGSEHSELTSRNEPKGGFSSLVFYDRNGMVLLPHVPTWLWSGYAFCSTMIVILGGMSFERPACDIFIAGITQSPSTFYVMALLFFGLVRHPVSRWTRIVGTIAFIMNAALLPLYPLLVQYTDWELGTVNLFLHCWLFVSWSNQGITLRQLAIAVDEYESKQRKEA